MNREITLMTLVVKNYEEAIQYYVNILGFVLIEDTPITDKKRWVVIAPQKKSRFKLLLAQPKKEQETKAIGNQNRLNLLEKFQKNIMGKLLFLKIYMEIYGI